MTSRNYLMSLTLSACLTPFARAELRFVTSSVELGEVRAGVPLAHVFHFINDGPDTVTVTEVQPGCGCLRPRLERQRFAPGEHGMISLEINTLGQAAGPHRWYMTVVYSDGVTPRDKKLEVAGKVITEVSVQPAVLTLFADGALVHEVTLTDLRAEPLAIERVLTTSPNLRVQAAPFMKTAFGHWTSRIRVETVGDLPLGPQEEFLNIYTNDPLYRELKVAVTLIRRTHPRIVATPDEVTLSAGPRLVRLRDRQDQPVMIESVTADDAAVVCTWAVGPDNQATIKLQPNPARLQGGIMYTQIRVQVNSPVREVLTVPVVVSNDVGR